MRATRAARLGGAKADTGGADEDRAALLSSCCSVAGGQLTCGAYGGGEAGSLQLSSGRPDVEALLAIAATAVPPGGSVGVYTAGERLC